MRFWNVYNLDDTKNQKQDIPTPLYSLGGTFVNIYQYYFCRAQDIQTLLFWLKESLGSNASRRGVEPRHLGQVVVWHLGRHDACFFFFLDVPGVDGVPSPGGGGAELLCDEDMWWSPVPFTWRCFKTSKPQQLWSTNCPLCFRNHAISCHIQSQPGSGEITSRQLWLGRTSRSSMCFPTSFWEKKNQMKKLKLSQWDVFGAFSKWSTAEWINNSCVLRKGFRLD